MKTQDFLENWRQNKLLPLQTFVWLWEWSVFSVTLAHANTSAQGTGTDEIDAHSRFPVSKPCAQDTH